MHKKNRIQKTIAFFALTAVLAGCSLNGIGITGQPTSVQPSETRVPPTDTPAPTLTQTATPTITPTATKVPDLEIFNSRWVDNPDNNGGLYLLGNIRNNTDTTMMMPSREYAFTLNIDEYHTFGDGFVHYAYGPLGIMPGVEVPKSNCILYPHEKGVIFSDVTFMDKMPGFFSKREEINKYDGNIGIFYTYTSAYKPAPALPTTYHPQAENVTFHIADGNIYFEYDINVPAPKHKETEKGMVRGFLTMYDRDGKIINFLYHEDIAYYLPWEHPYDNTVHMQGESPWGDVPVHWSYLMRITNDQLQKVDHIELLFETQYEGICFEKRYID
jgi:hypothetical protein